MSVTVQCHVCNEVFVLVVTNEQMAAWESGVLIQKAMPNLSPGERELLISGTCGTCFDELFGAEDDDN